MATKINTSRTRQMLAELQVNYVSLPPGAGKTNAAIEMMVRHLKGQLDMPGPPKYIFYVAATKLLLTQTANNLLKIIKKERGLRSKIRIAYSEDQRYKKEASVQEQVQNILNGRTNDGKEAQEFKAGSVLFITHEAFLMLSATHQDLYKHTVVLFDETRKWADMTHRVALDAQALDFFNKLFVQTPMKDSQGKTVKGIVELTALPFAENKKVTALKGCGKLAARAFKHLDELHTALNVKADAPQRMRAFAALEESRKAGYSKTLIQAKLPSFPFIGFQEVFILSADFPTSQMYYFLKHDGTRVINRSRWFMDTFHPDGYDLVVRRATDRYRYVDIVALNTDQNPPALGRYLTGGFMMPRHKIVEFGNLMADWDMSGEQVMEALSRVHAPLKNRPTKLDKGLYKILKDMGAQMDMLGWMVESSHRIVRAWRKKNPSKEKALLFLNQDFHEKMEVDRELFQELNHAETVGDNRWRKSNAVVFLAAINPQPRVTQILRAVIGYLGYDPHEDYIVDKVMQATGRGNIRTHGIQERMLIVVPTENLALRAAERMHEQPTMFPDITAKLGNYMSWDYKTYMASKVEIEDPQRAARWKRERVARKRVKRQKRVLSAEEKLRERALYQAAYRAKQEGDMERYSALEAQRDALRFVQ